MIGGTEIATMRDSSNHSDFIIMQAIAMANILLFVNKHFEIQRKFEVIYIVANSSF